MRKLSGIAVLLSFLYPLLAHAQAANPPKARLSQHSFPLLFEPAQDNSPNPILIQGHAEGRSIAFSANGLEIQAATPREAPLRITFAQAAATLPTGLDLQQSRTNYLLGKDPSGWRIGVANYARVGYHQLYPGVDALFYGNGHALEHDFIVAPQADYHQIRLRFSLGTHLSVDRDGALHIQRPSEELRLEKPFIYQLRGEQKQRRTGSFHLLPDGQVGFSVQGYDHHRPLVIDPVLSFSTYVGTQPGAANLVATDAAGDTYVAGYTNPNFPVTPGAFTSCSGCVSSTGVTLVSKISPDGTKLLYSTVLGGNNFAQPTGLAVDAKGNILLSGWTSASNFPTKNGLPVDLSNNNSVGFLVSLTPDGSALNFGTLFGCKPASGPSGDTTALALALDTSGDVFVTGITDNGFPTTPGALNQQASTSSYSNSFNVFLVKFSPLGALIYSATLGVADPQNGGGGPIGAYALAVDAAGDAFVAGQAGTLWPITSGAYLSSIAGSQPFATPFVSKVSPDGKSLLYSTYLDYAYVVAGIAPLSDGSVVVAGTTPGPAFPTTSGAYQQNNGKSGAFLTRLNASGSALVYSTVLGDPTFSIHGMALAPDGSVWLAGQTGSSASPLVNPVQGTFPLSQVVRNAAPLIEQFDPSLNTLQFSTFLGGPADGYASAVAVDSAGRAHVSGAVGYGLFTTSGAATSSVPVPGQGYGGETFPFAALLDPAVPAPALCASPNDQVDFAVVALNGHADQQVKLSSCGTQPLTITNLTAGAAAYTVPTAGNSCTQTLSPGQTCTFTVRYTPTAVQQDLSTLTIASNAAETTQTLTLSGQGALAPLLQVSPATITFAPQLPGTTATAQTLTVTNAGSGPATNLQINLLGPNVPAFSETTTCTSSLAVGASCTVALGFAPQAAGAFSADLQILDAVDQPFTSQDVSVSGSSPFAAFALAPSSTQSTSASVQAGLTASYPLTFSVANGYKGTLSFSCGTLPQNASCSITPATLAAVGGANASVTVSIGTEVTQTSALAPNLKRGSALLALALLPFFRRRKRARTLVPALLMALFCITGCSSSGGTSSTPPPAPLKVAPGTYTIPLVISDGTNKITQNLTLTVQ